MLGVPGSVLPVLLEGRMLPGCLVLGLCSGEMGRSLCCYGVSPEITSPCVRILLQCFPIPPSWLLWPRLPSAHTSPLDMACCPSPSSHCHPRGLSRSCALRAGRADPPLHRQHGVPSRPEHETVLAIPRVFPSPQLQPAASRVVLAVRQSVGCRGHLQGAACVGPAPFLLHWDPSQGQGGWTATSLTAMGCCQPQETFTWPPDPC